VTKEDILAVLEEIRRLREDFNRQQEVIIKLREDFNRHEERIGRLYEEIRRLREDFNRLSNRVELKISAIGARWGILSEESFREGMRFVLENYFKARVDKWKYYDSEGYVYGEPTEIEVDLLITDSERILIEIKASVDRSDIAELKRIGELYEKATGVKPKLIMVSPFVTGRAIKLAKKLGIEIISGIPI